MESKTCTKCNTDKQLNKFNKSCTSKDGHHTICKVCRVAANKAYLTANPKKQVKNKKIWAEANKKKMAEYQRNYRLANKSVAVASTILA